MGNGHLECEDDGNWIKCCTMIEVGGNGHRERLRLHVVKEDR